MKLNLAIPGLLIALLVGCNDTTTVATSVSPSATPSPTTTSVVSEKTPTPSETTTPVVSEKIPTPTITSTKSANPFDSDSFPKASCGDRMPTDKKPDIVKLYPVFVDYSDSNLQTIKANYCGDALKITTKDKGKYVIQVGSFTSTERANQFKEFLGTKFVNAQVGEPTVIAVKPKGDVNTPSDIKTKGEKAKKSTNISNSASSIGKAAQLTPKQIKELIEMENRLTVSVDKSNLKLEKVKAILPTYVPPGFKVEDFRISLCNSSGAKSGRYSYYITYRNSSNSSFNIQTRPCRVFMSKPTIVKDIQISSKKFERVNLQLIKFERFDKLSNDTQISGEILSSNPKYPGDFQKLLSLTSQGSNLINWQEARKIMESMDYLNNQN